MNVSVDATAAGTPLERVWPFHGYDEINYTTTPEGKALLGAIAAAHSAPVHVRSHFLLNTGDGTPGAEVGIDQRLHRGRRRQSRLQLGPDRRDHGHHHRRRGVSVRRDRLHARGALDAPDPLSQLQHHDARRRLLLSADRLHEVGGSHQHVGDARQRTLPGRRGELAVGAVERTGLRLLAGDGRRVREALRLHRIGAARGAPGRAAGRPGGGGRRRQLPAPVSQTLRDRHQCRHGQRRDAPRPRDVPREGRGGHRRRPRRDGPPHPAPASPGGVQRGRRCSPVQPDAHLRHRGGSRRMRRLPGEHHARRRVPHLARLRRLRDRDDEAQPRARGRGRA